MDNLKHRYNPDFFHQRALETLDTVTQEDAASWFHHPCTQTLINALEGDLAGIVIVWLGGGYSSEDNIDITAQNNAKARGMAQGIDNVLDTIKRIRKLSLREESVSYGN